LIADIGECGPMDWAHSYPNAGGKHQSPINIETAKTVYDPNLSNNKLSIEYSSEDSCRQIKNTGHTFQVDSNTDNKTSILILCYTKLGLKFDHDIMYAI
jgi:carbonic anhydrase